MSVYLQRESIWKATVLNTDHRKKQTNQSNFMIVIKHFCGMYFIRISEIVPYLFFKVNFIIKNFFGRILLVIISRVWSFRAWSAFVVPHDRLFRPPAEPATAGVVHQVTLPKCSRSREKKNQRSAYSYACHTYLPDREILLSCSLKTLEGLLRSI